MTQNLFNTFIILASRLNQDLNITPLLYGSLGLELITNSQLNPQDIDVLIPEEFIQERWNDLFTLMTVLGYTLIDLREHEFLNDKIRVAFAKIEELNEFAGVDVELVKTLEHKGTEYKLLNLEQYHRVYKRSSIDGYRSIKKNNKDLEKINLIESQLRD
ncbi:hypothetical protein [Cohnella cholangitidis]|uniref:Phosphoribosylanthranilate isomerase n=1 Tax=Cohnella cholangitidis TaxID=2598458 RepID=A0A7G5BSW5_9BACL|nr:hypothetical protein [Cohnella cholangitidis]QMV40049.1 hypothetical protein FPL14_01660 [Cohnella cholangitidis]